MLEYQVSIYKNSEWDNSYNLVEKSAKDAVTKAVCLYAERKIPDFIPEEEFEISVKVEIFHEEGKL